MRWFVLLFLSLVFAGCFSHSMAQDKHAQFYGCPASQVSSEDVESEGHKQVVTTGCGHTETFFCIGIKCRSPRILAIRMFSDDQSCDQNQIVTQSAGAEQWTVSGCGKTVQYRCTEVPNDVIRCTPLSP